MSVGGAGVWDILHEIVKGYFNGLVTVNVKKVPDVRVRRCVCVCVCGGKMYLLLVRGVSRSKTLIPLILVTIRLDAFYYNNK